MQTHFSSFSKISCKISWRKPGGISPALSPENFMFLMKLIDFAFTSNFSQAFRHEIYPGNFLFLHENLNFTLRHFLHETGNVFCLYKHCSLAN